MNTKEFLGLKELGSDRHYQMVVAPHLSTPGQFLFGGCGLGAALEALEIASGRQTIWATAQYLSYAKTGSVVDYEVTLSIEGGHITQGRAVATSEGREVLTVNAALGVAQGDLDATWVEPPKVPPPKECPERVLPIELTGTILDRVEVRMAKGRREFNGVPGDASTALWARVPDLTEVTTSTLGIFGDYVSGGASEPLGKRMMGRSLDNTIRIAKLIPTHWVLCDIRMHAAISGYAQGLSFLWTENGQLLATASQSLSVRFWPESDSV